LITKLSQKDQELKAKLGEEMKKIEAKVSEQKGTEMANKYDSELRNLKSNIEKYANQITAITRESEVIKANLKVKDGQIEGMRLENLKQMEAIKRDMAADRDRLLREEATKMEQAIRGRLESEIQKRERDIDLIRGNLERERQEVARVTS
jgi:hypothetical protein